MKPLSEWIPAQKMEFFDLLIGLEERDFYSKWEYFFMVKDFMEKEMPEVWEKYLSETVQREFYYDGTDRYTSTFNKQLSLDNLLSFLMENTEMWGWEECEYMKEWPRILPNGGSAFFCEKQCKDKPINCNGGKVKHPALLYAEGVK